MYSLSKYWSYLHIISIDRNPGGCEKPSQFLLARARENSPEAIVGTYRALEPTRSNIVGRSCTLASSDSFCQLTEKSLLIIGVLVGSPPKIQ